MWTGQPTLATWVWMIATWIVRPFLFDAQADPAFVVRKIAGAVVGTAFTLGVTTGIIWYSIDIAGHVTSNVVLQCVVTALLIFVADRLMTPLLMVLSIPITFLILWPIDFIFPAKRSS
jgi:uncharacterized membrane protein YvlD (DUF360 family)